MRVEAKGWGEGEGEEEGGDELVMQMRIEMSEIPYADVFNVEVRWAARKVGRDVNISVGLFIVFLKSSLFKRQIKTGTFAETIAIQKQLLEATRVRVGLLMVGAEEAEKKKEEKEGEGERGEKEKRKVVQGGNNHSNNSKHGHGNGSNVDIKWVILLLVILVLVLLHQSRQIQHLEDIFERLNTRENENLVCES